jgi:hypothetical protein
MAEAPSPSLTTLERTVIALAIKDADAGFIDAVDVGTPLRTKLSAMHRKITATRGYTPLANPRLETLRRFAGATHRLHQPADRLVPDLVAQGFDRDTINAVSRLAI